MHRAIGYLSKRFVQIRPGEGRKVLLTFCYFFLVITAYYLVKPASRSLILGELGSRIVPYVDLVAAILMGPIVYFFARLVDRMPKHQLISGSFWVVIGVLLVFWRLLSWPIPWVAAFFYIWVAIFSVLVVTLFWLVANDLYRPREAKRLFGFIGSGGILGGICGASIAGIGAQVIGTENLLLLSAGVLLLSWLIVQQLWTYSPERAAAEGAPPARPRRETFLSNPGGFAKLLLQSRYLLLLIAVVGLGKIIGTLVYYQFNPFIEAAFPDQDAKTTFISLFLTGMNAASFIVQFFFTSWVLRRWGLSVALFVLPIGLLLGTVGLLVLPVFWLAASTELYSRSMNYSLQQTTKEVLYLPIDRSVRYKIKPFIDMVVFRFGKGLAAILGIILLDALRLPAYSLGYVAVPLVIAWLAAAFWLRRDYVERIRTALEARAATRRHLATPQPEPRRAEPSPGEDATPAGVSAELTPFGSLTEGQRSEKKVTLMNEVVGADTPRSPHAKDLIVALTVYETRLEGPPEFGGELQQLRLVIGDQSEPMARRCHSIRVLARSSDQAVFDYLFGLVMVETDTVLRHEAGRALVRLRLRDGRMGFPVQPIRRQIAAEVDNYLRIRQIASIYRRHHREPPAANDPLIGLLRMLTEESVEQLFRFLMLLYRPEDIHLVYEQFRVSDTYLRTDAIELLDNLVEPAMRRIIFPILDEDRFLSGLEEGREEGVIQEPAASRLLQRTIWDRHSWLSVTTLCAVGRMRLDSMRQELERASYHTSPLISTAAKVALDLSASP